MNSVNKVILIGNLGRDPETRYLPSGDTVVNISIATVDKWNDKNGNKQERIEWHRVILHNGLAKVSSLYLKKGNSVYIEGKIQTKKYIKDDIEHLAVEIVASEMKMLS